MWITVRQFAERNNISVQAVSDRINRNSLKCKFVGKKRYVEVPDEDPQAGLNVDENLLESDIEKNKILSDKFEIDAELKRKKIENIRMDVILKRQKSKDYLERKRVEFCEGVLEAYTDAFADLKGVLVDLKLRKEQIRKFKDVYSKCLKKFETELTKYLKQKDKDENGEEGKDD